MEVQGYFDGHFAERMFDYFSLIRHYYKHSVISLAILTDSDKNYRPTTFETKEYGCHNLFEYPIVKLLDYQTAMAQLESDSNPFSLVVLAHLRSQAVREVLAKQRKSKATRLLPVAANQDLYNELVNWKVHFVHLLKQRQYSETQAGQLFEFMGCYY